MKWTDIDPVFFPIIAMAVLFVIVLVAQRYRSKRLLGRLELLAREMGWYDVKSSSFLISSIQGTWNGYSVRIRRLPRQKSIPERVVSTIRVQAPARLTITRRQRGLFTGRPIAMFGPPLVELPLYPQFWIRADEITLAERLLRSSAAAMLDRIVLTRHDFFKMAGDELLVQRVSSNDPDEVARLAREELELLRAVVDALALRP